MSSNSDLTCPECGYRGVWQDYFCPDCQRHFDRLYLEEHHDPLRAMTMNRADIIQEYHEAGVPFRAGRMG